MIQVEGLTKDFGLRRAIDQLDFHAAQGEVVGFLGPNGAGKTTTMRILSGYMPPTAGQARIAGFDVLRDSLEVRRRVGYLPENVPLYPDMTVYDYLKFMADLRHLKRPEHRILEVIAQVNLESRARSRIGNLSKGMRQRVGLAQALIHEPAVLILDEPTLGLDPGQIIEVRKLIQDLGSERTVLLSTHILTEAQQICDRVLIINKGKIIAEDTPERLQAHLRGAYRVLVQVRGEGEGLASLLEIIPGVGAVTQLAEGRLEISSTPGQDVRPQVARTILEAGYDLLELQTTGISLEDVFIELIREETNGPDPYLEQAEENRLTGFERAAYSGDPEADDA